MISTFVKRFPLEAIVWMAALIALAIHRPDAGLHFTLCPLSNLGFDACPGCGLGRSISYVFHGAFAQAYQTHPLGIFAVIVLLYRIISLTLTHIQRYGKNP